MAKSNYVGVVFSNEDDAKEYIYRVPEYVNIDDADHERWVLVEDAFYDADKMAKRMPPQRFAFIVNVYRDTYFSHVTKNIACIVPGSLYVDSRRHFEYARELDEIEEMLKTFDVNELKSMKQLIKIAIDQYGI